MIQDFWQRYERRIGWGALALGFIVDTFTLDRVDLWFENLVLIIYLAVATIAIFIMSASGEGGHRTWLVFALQFAFGGLFSAFVILYTRSATLISSWPFLLILAVLLIGNELFKEHYMRLSFQLSLLYIAIFSYLIFLVPVLTGTMGALMFIVSGVASLIVIALIIYLLGKFDRHGHGFAVTKGLILGLFVVFNVLYFNNTIPPIPLSLKESGIYLDARRQGESFALVQEDLSWYEFYKRDEINHVPDTPIFAFSSIFAPTKLSGEVFHDWYKLNRTTGDWVRTDHIPLPVIGGRDGGYRGFSRKQNIAPGEWRVDIVTARKQLIGRESFTITNVSQTPQVEVIFR